MLMYLKVLFSLLFLDNNEKNFLKGFKLELDVSKNKKNIFIEVNPDYYFLIYYACRYNAQINNRHRRI